MTNDEEIEKLKAYVEVHPDDADGYYQLGRHYWKLGKTSEAMSAYAQGAELAPEGAAAIALDQARQIMAFYNKDLYNP